MLCNKHGLLLKALFNVKFQTDRDLKCSWEDCIFPKTCEDNVSCKIWATNTGFIVGPPHNEGPRGW